TQFDPASKYFDPKATREKPIWDCVDVEFVAKLPYMVSLQHIKADPELANMVLLRISRLSVQPVEEAEFKRIVELGQVEPPPLPMREKVARKVKAAKTARAKKPAKKPARKPQRAATKPTTRKTRKR